MQVRGLAAAGVFRNPSLRHLHHILPSLLKFEPSIGSQYKDGLYGPEVLRLIGSTSPARKRTPKISPCSAIRHWAQEYLDTHTLRQTLLYIATIPLIQPGMQARLKITRWRTNIRA